MRRERPGRAAGLLLALLLLGTSAAAPALDPAPVLLQADALKRQALELGYRAAGLDEAARDQRHPDISVYLAAGNSAAAILAARLIVDGAAPAFGGPLRAQETQALQPGSTTYRLARLQLAPGSHHLHAEILLRYAGEAEARSLVLDQDCPIDAAPVDLVLAPQGKGWLLAPQLQLYRQNAGPTSGPGLIDLRKIWSQVNGPEVREGAYRPGGEGDPLLGYARLLTRTGDCFKAAVLLQRMGQGRAAADLPPEYFGVLAEALLGLDALDLAQQAYGQAVSAGLDTAGAADLRVRIAEHYYQRQDFAGAEKLMGEEPPRRARAQYTQWQDLRARIMLSQRRFEDASPALAAADAGADFDSYVRYFNLGVALIQNGLGPQGVTVLDRVGTIPSNDRHMISLRDSANLALGAYLLQSGQGATAIPVLERIEIDGPGSDRAILDLGWAWLAPAGTQQARVMLGDERMRGAPPESLGALRHAFDSRNVYQRYHLSPFVRARLEDSRAARVRHALDLWSELLGRDPSSDAVQEAFLAAAMALQNLGARREAAGLYSRGADALEAARRTDEDAARYVRSDRWVGELLEASPASTRLDIELRRLPPSAVSGQLEQYLAGWDFQNGLLQYRILETLAANLDGAAGGPDEAAAVAAFDQQIARAKAGQVGILRQQQLDRIAARQLRLTQLLQGARFELARLYDGAAP